MYIVSLQVFENALSPNGEEPPLWRHVVVTVVITLLVGAISMTTDCLGIVLELNVSMIIFNNFKGINITTAIVFVVVIVCLNV